MLTELKFTDEFLATLRNIPQRRRRISAAAINQASLSIYFEKSDYDSRLDPIAMAETYETALPRLGMYTDYKKLTPVADYWYTYETSGTTLAYDGYINRSLGCYKMNISSYIQAIVNEGTQARTKQQRARSTSTRRSKAPRYRTLGLRPVHIQQIGGAGRRHYTINPASIRPRTYPCETPRQRYRIGKP